MIAVVFVGILGVGLALLLGWGFKVLPAERWQILAAIPTTRAESGRWQGINLTYYGFFTASSLLIAVSIIYILMGALGVSAGSTSALVGLMCLCCLPAAKLIARYVENKAYGFTIGGACFIGVLTIPWSIGLLNWLSRGGSSIPVIHGLAAVSIAYAFGEGIGRLACVSFGCCYGKPVDQCSPLLRKVFDRCCFTFSGETKKISYAGGLEHHKVVPIQAITATLYVATGLVSLILFLTAHAAGALILSMSVTQLWRAVSELLRADYRGEQKISAYQIMSLVAVAYVMGVLWLLPSAQPLRIDLLRGLQTLWNPLLIMMLQSLWVVVFIYTGRSMVTGSTLSFHVIKDRI